MYKSFAITGSQPLLKAMEETLVKEGFKAKNCSFLDDTYPKGADKLVSTINNPKDKEQFLQLTSTYLETTSSSTFNLPEQWNEALTFILDQLKPKIEVGSWVIGEYGLYPKHAVKVLSIKGQSIKYNTSNPDSKEPDNSNSLRFVRLATPQEIEAVQTVMIGNYKAEKDGFNIKFGCQSFSMEDLKSYKKLLNDNINAQIVISGTTITNNVIDKLINKL